MSILIKLYVLSDLSSDIIALFVHFSEKKFFETRLSHLTSIQTSKSIRHYCGLQLSTKTKSPKIWDSFLNSFKVHLTYATCFIASFSFAVKSRI